jgi:hypothetical protein
MTGKHLWEAACDGDVAKVCTLLPSQGAQSFINYQDANGSVDPFSRAKHLLVFVPRAAPLRGKDMRPSQHSSLLRAVL